MRDRDFCPDFSRMFESDIDEQMYLANRRYDETSGFSLLASGFWLLASGFRRQQRLID